MIIGPRDWYLSYQPAPEQIDTKHAMHLVRLQRMAIEILTTGQIRVRRDDRDELLSIRDGALFYGDLIAECDRLRARTAAVAIASDLPARPDESTMTTLCCTLVEEVLGC